MNLNTQVTGFGDPILAINHRVGIIDDLCTVNPNLYQGRLTFDTGFYRIILIFLPQVHTFGHMLEKSASERRVNCADFSIGTVIDGDSKEPLPGVNVILEGTTMGAATDENGYFLLLMYHREHTN